MYQSTAKSREALLVDIEEGILLQTPPSPTVSRRYIESHPFIFEFRSPASGDNFIVAGPDARKVAGGSGGTDYALYRIDSEAAGSLRLTREA